jgi:hypothetical protein
MPTSDSTAFWARPALQQKPKKLYSGETEESGVLSKPYSFSFR